MAQIKSKNPQKANPQRTAKNAQNAQSRHVKIGLPNEHAKVPLDAKNLLKMHISQHIMNHLMKIK